MGQLKQVLSPTPQFKNGIIGLSETMVTLRTQLATIESIRNGNFSAIPNINPQVKNGLKILVNKYIPPIIQAITESLDKTTSTAQKILDYQNYIYSLRQLLTKSVSTGSNWSDFNRDKTAVLDDLDAINTEAIQLKTQTTAMQQTLIT